MNRDNGSSSIASIKLAIAASPSIDVSRYLHSLASHCGGAQVRDYAIGALDALCMEMQHTSRSSSSRSVNISLRALLGHVHFQSIQEVLLGHADGVLVVLDMHPSQRNETMQTILQTVQGLRRQGLDIHQIPLVLEYYHADQISEAMIAEWDHLLEWERHEIPRILSATHHRVSSVLALETLMYRVLAPPRLSDL